MKKFTYQHNCQETVLALGGESAGGFTVFCNNQIFFQTGFGDLLDDKKYSEYKDSISLFLEKNKLSPTVILTDSHPLFRATELGEELTKKYRAKKHNVQHHLAHIFGVYGEGEALAQQKPLACFTGIAIDGTGLGLDDKIWGGEIFQIDLAEKKFVRFGHLEYQTLLGSDMAIREPARLLIGILDKFLDKKEVFSHLQKHYSANDFELLFNQARDAFNCLDTSSTGRVLDAVSVLLGFSPNQIAFKHEPIVRLEKNSASPYEIKPLITFDKTEKAWVLSTTAIFEYLIKNMDKDKKRLAASAQLYIAKGFFEIASKNKNEIFMGGGLSKNKIISTFLVQKNVHQPKKFLPGDDALSFGQLFYYLKML